ncbi:uncharacterized protein PAC_14481 [Phialocephala subalpina]|uniref:Gfd2/YDR514C-like C-terminal domain-containing protein n=1 Tax=Phialocephala subalpina TaxID=576137 RepID=A0A1L7XHQ9_9HELO|nr:uncharacterized protein PAC_14481 [Phialocephala subalpina]
METKKLFTPHLYRPEGRQRGEFHHGEENSIWGLAALQHCLGLASGKPSIAMDDFLASRYSQNSGTYDDVVFVSLDIEGSFHTIREIGISTLDTRDLRDLKCDPSVLISTHNYRIWTDEKAEMQRPFRFGTSKRLEKRWMGWLIEKCMKTGSPELTKTEPRTTVLVGHNLRSDFEVLGRTKRGGRFIIQKFPDQLILDTAFLKGQEYRGPRMTRTQSLKDTCTEFGIECTKSALHCAGNDANLTMKALMIIAAQSCADEELDVRQQDRRDFLETVARQPLPRCPYRDVRLELIDDEELLASPRADPSGDWSENCDGVLGLPDSIEDTMLYR